MRLLFLLLLPVFASAQQRDTLACRALFSDPQSAAQNKRVSVTKFYVILENGKPVKFLMADKKRETTMDIWDYKLINAPRVPRQKKE